MITEMKLLLPILVFIGLFAKAPAARVLLVPIQYFSHVQTLTVIGEVLIKRGHEVDCMMHKLATGAFPKEAKKAGIKPIIFGDDSCIKFFEPGFLDPYFSEHIKPGNQNILAQLNLMRTLLFPELYEISKCLLKDEIINELRKNKYDFIVFSAINWIRPNLLVSELLNVPFASIVSEAPTDLLSSLFRIPSIDPIGYGDEYTGEKLNFVERIKNSFTFYVMTLFGYHDFDASPYLKNSDCKDLQCVAGKSAVWIIDKSPMISLPLPRGPNAIYVPGLSTNKPNPLATEFQSYADSAKDGLVVMSLGSGVKNIPEGVLSSMLEAFEKFPKLKFILRHENKLASVPKNVKLTTWLPQNDVLAHKNTVIFITHCGNSGLHEGLRNGVPMIGTPLYGDQNVNAKKLEIYGYGRKLSFATMTTDRIVETIKDVLSNETIRLNIKKASAITKSYPLPREQAADLIEHVIKYGADHLRSVSSDMHWFQVLMWDIAYFLLAMFIILLMIIYYVGIKLVRLCCKKKKEKTS